MSTLKCNVYPTAFVTFSDLVKKATTFNAAMDCTCSMILNVMFDPHAEPKYGAFKQAVFGFLDQPTFGTSNCVVIKKSFYISPFSGKKILYDPLTQLKELTTEINCLRWGSALMELVYDFVDEYIQKHGQPPIPIPRMSFVKNALAVTLASEKTQEVFLLEETIKDVGEDGFVKYIGNGSVVPFDFLDEEAAQKAEFLAFAQHVQYIETKGLAFIGDFQGKCSIVLRIQTLNMSI